MKHDKKYHDTFESSKIGKAFAKMRWDKTTKEERQDTMQKIRACKNVEVIKIKK